MVELRLVCRRVQIILTGFVDSLRESFHPCISLDLVAGIVPGSFVQPVGTVEFNLDSLLDVHCKASAGPFDARGNRVRMYRQVSIRPPLGTT
jgi:hypothetical protein